jgi:hypothetical protein
MLPEGTTYKQEAKLEVADITNNGLTNRRKGCRNKT